MSEQPQDWVARGWRGDSVIAEKRFATQEEALIALAQWNERGAYFSCLTLGYMPMPRAASTKEEPK